MVRGNDMIQRSRGVALIAVLWIVAAMAIAVTGMAHAVRNEIRTVAAARSGVETQALGEAAIALAVQKMLAQRPFQTAGLRWMSLPWPDPGRGGRLIEWLDRHQYGTRHLVG